jgi:hypothetical protein
LESLEPAVVESHISRKTSEIWGTRDLFPFPLLRPKGMYVSLPTSSTERDVCFLPTSSTERDVSSFCPFHMAGVPHIPDFLGSLAGSANFMRLSFKERRTRRPVRCHVQEIRGISLVFREMWDSTNVSRATLL